GPHHVHLSFIPNPGSDQLPSSKDLDVNITPTGQITPTVILTIHTSGHVTSLGVDISGADTDATATGSVQFLNGSTVIDTDMLVDGKASFNAVNLSGAITVHYFGDATFQAGDSAPIQVQPDPLIPLSISLEGSFDGPTVTLTATLSQPV